MQLPACCLFFCQPCPGLLSRYSWQSLNMVDGGCEFSFIRGIHVRTDIRVDISISLRTMQAGTSRGVNSNDTSQAGAADVKTSRSCDTPKTLYLHYLSAYDHQTWQDSKLPSCTLAMKSHDPLITWSFEMRQTKTIIFPLLQCYGHQTWQDDD